MSDSKQDEPKLSGSEFAAQYAACERQLRAFVHSIHPFAADVDDILQETLSVLWEKFAEFDPERPFFSWACGFAYRKTLEHRRREARHRKVFSEETIEALKRVSESVPEERVRRETVLSSCLEALGAKDRGLIENRYAGEQSLKELAEQAGTSANALYKRLQRIRFILGECVERKMGGAS